jgi:hypothetical protein
MSKRERSEEAETAVWQLVFNIEQYCIKLKDLMNDKEKLGS